MLGRQAEIAISLIFLILGLIAVFVWVPMDSETGMTDTFRRQTNIGDAFMPMISAGVMVICAFAQLVVNFRRKGADDTENRAIDGSAFAFLVQFAGITTLSLVLMYWAGPIAVQLFGPGEGADALTYRQLRSTYPFKLVGFALGGFSLIFFMTSLIEGSFKRTRVISSLIAVLVLIAVFDLPLDNVLLPPNGDW